MGWAEFRHAAFRGNQLLTTGRCEVLCCLARLARTRRFSSASVSMRFDTSSCSRSECSSADTCVEQQQKGNMCDDAESDGVQITGYASINPHGYCDYYYASGLSHVLLCNLHQIEPRREAIGPALNPFIPVRTQCGSSPL